MPEAFIEKEFTEDCIQHMMKYSWPGNIRELRNVTERLMILCGNEITGDDVKAFATPAI